ncbi:uncharacterized protein LOC106636804 [Copidosoma floridanum]|uniref:uncharacterized protein LOC106636804 n=1 Tax=Copidosoma floridanum TaxID=29053 RepID=UPI0006C947E7|nr:uncharacterized protein LOC106636804 [Copidosoma floridanum]
MDAEVLPDEAVDNADSKVKVENVKEVSKNEPVIKKPKFDENKEEGDFAENIGRKEFETDEQVSKECKILEEDDTDEEIEFNKDGLLYFIERLTTTETTHEQKLEEFKEYLEADLEVERQKYRQEKLERAQEKYKNAQKEEEKKSDNKASSSKKADSDNEDDSMEHEVPEPGFIYPLEQDASDMLYEVDFNEDGTYPTVTERYLTPYYAIDVKEPCDDICIYIHSNRVCMITLAPSHIIFQKNLTIESCSYQVTEKLDRTKNKVSGKGKRGAQPMQKNSYLCRLTCSDGSVYMIRCCMNGKLLEVNEKLLENPELLKQPPHSGGYIAVVLPNLKYHDEQLKKHLLDQKQYEEALSRRIMEKKSDASQDNEKKEESGATEEFLNLKSNKNDDNTQIEGTNMEKQEKQKLDDIKMDQVCEME